MDRERFDALARLLATTGSRRAALGSSPKEDPMRKSSLVWTLLAVSAAITAIAVIVVITGGLQLSRVGAQEGTPAAGSGQAGTHTIVLVEHIDHQTTLDLGEPGASAGDLLYWGPNPLYDEANTTDTGAVTMGACVVITADFDCMLVETITFPDGSTLQFQGGQPSAVAPYLRTIVGGSGAYLGAIGSAEAIPSDDGKLWTRTIEVQAP